MFGLFMARWRRLNIEVSECDLCARWRALETFDFPNCVWHTCEMRSVLS